nr:tandem-95 repeat protein [Prolixibacteraceae bacterium]
YDYSSLTIFQSPQSGKAYINSSNGVISYFPEKNFTGKDSLHYKICDTGLPVYCDDAWMIITVNPVNDNPIPTPLVLETNINTPVTFNALNQVFDIDDGINPGSIDISGLNKIKLSGDSIIYTPDSSYTGKDEFTYSVSDYEGVPAFVIVTVIVKDTLSEFIAANDTITIQENGVVDISVLENDTKGNEFPDPRSLEIKVFPKNGVAEYDWYKQVVSYQPDKNFNGKDSITYIVSSGLKNWSSAKVYINVEPVNDSLRANDDLAETIINTPVEIHILKNDIDSDNGIDYTSVKFDTEIEYNDENGIATFTPPLNFKGIYSFTYKVCDNDFINTSCDSATVVVIVNQKKKELYAINDDYSTFENDTIDLVEPLLPWENDSLIVSDNKIVPDSFDVVLPPQHGTYTLNQETNIITYIPEKDFYGNDWMTYLIYDDAGNFDVAEINIWVEKVNVPPVAVSDNYMISQNEFKRLYILENDFDIDGNLDFSTLKITSNPKSGKDSIDLKTGTIFYKPDVNKGDDSLRYTICDNEGACTSATVKMTIELDTSIFIYLTTLEDNPVETDIKAEMEKYNFKFNITEVVEEESPEIGKWELTENNSILRYTPEKDSTGDDNFRLNVCSGESGQCAFLRIYVKILPVNDPPVAINDTIFWNHITDTTTITYNDITRNDYDIDSEIIILYNKSVDSGDSLKIKFNKDKELITITADTIFWCDAWFTYKILDQEGASDTGKVFIFPYPDSYNFAANNDEKEVFENSKDNLLNILENDIFIDNQLCTIDTVIIITPSVNGISSATNDNNISYNPLRHYYGKDSLQYQIIDLWGKKDSAWVYIDILERNTPPLANPDDTIAAFGTIINIPVLSNDYDPDAIDLPGSPGDPDAFIDSSRTVIISDPLFGTAYFDPATYNIVYTPDIESCENDVFEYRIFDNENDSSSTTITIIMPEEAPIMAIPDTVKTYPGIPVEVEPLLNDQGYFAKYIESNTNPSNGFISINSSNIVRYTPNKDFIGRDSIKYSITSPCENISEAYIIFLVEELRVPEIITPNGDRKNDVLIIDGIEYFPDNMFQIYNRYGHIVYSKKTYDNTWGGYSNKGSLFGDKPLPAGTYYWTLIYNEGRNRQAGIIYIFR